MDCIRVLHFADLHIGMENYGQIDPETGVNGRVMDFLRRLNGLVDYALEGEVDLVLFCGDAYKTREPSVTHQREFARRIRRLTSAGIPVVLLVGNHDLPGQEKRASSVDIFHALDVPKVVVANREGLHRLTTRRGGVIQVAAVPYPMRQRLLEREEYKRKTIAELDKVVEQIVADNIQALASDVDRSLPAILAGHFTASEAEYGSERSVMLGRDVVVLKGVLADPAWDYVALGHIHRHQEISGGQRPPIVYCGSLERIDFGEEHESKGFVVADIRRGACEWRFQQVEARRFVTIDADVRQASAPLEALLETIGRHQVEDAVVRVRVKARSEQEEVLRDADVRRALKDAYFVAGISKEVERAYRQRLGGASPEGLTPRELLARYLESKGTPSERAQALQERAESIFQGEQDA